MYRADQVRAGVEREYSGPKEDFLATLDMRFTIARATGEDLRRAAELTVRTSQLNTTGYTYSYEELDAFRESPGHELLVARLADRYGPYGTIGLVLVERGRDAWRIKLLLMSCRVMSRGWAASSSPICGSVPKRPGCGCCRSSCPTVATG